MIFMPTATLAEAYCFPLFPIWCKALRIWVVCKILQYSLEFDQYNLKLKVAWFKDFLGLAIEQVNFSREYSLTPYYFWPKTEAWEQLKLELDSKLWLTSEEKIKILKTTSEVMNFWLSHRTTKDSKDLKESFQEIEVVTL